MNEDKLAYPDDWIPKIKAFATSRLMDENVILPIDQEVRTDFARFLEAAPDDTFATVAMDQLATCLTLGPWLTETQFNTLAREIGIGAMLHRHPLEQPDLAVFYRHIGKPGRVIVEKAFPAKQILSIADCNVDVIDLLQRPVLWAENGRTGSGPTISMLDFLTFEQDQARAVKILERLNYFYLTHDTFYKHIPAGAHWRAYDDASFWVQELPMSNSIVYTANAGGLLEHPLLGWSNMMHEMGGHILMGRVLHPLFTTPSGKKIYLHPKLVLPVWFWEGTANISSYRYLISRDPSHNEIPLQTDFTDLFLSTWDGQIPKAEDILRADERLSYFFHTVFCAYILQTVGQAINPSGGDPRDSLDTPNLQDIMYGFQLYLTSINAAVPQLLPDPQKGYDIRSEFMSHLHTSAIEIARSAYKIELPVLHIIYQRFDAEKEAYIKAWIAKYFTPDQAKTAYNTMYKSLSTS